MHSYRWNIQHRIQMQYLQLITKRMKIFNLKSKMSVLMIVISSTLFLTHFNQNVTHVFKLNASSVFFFFFNFNQRQSYRRATFFHHFRLYKLNSVTFLHNRCFISRLSVFLHPHSDRLCWEKKIQRKRDEKKWRKKLNAWDVVTFDFISQFPLFLRFLWSEKEKYVNLLSNKKKKDKQQQQPFNNASRVQQAKEEYIKENWWSSSDIRWS